MGESSVVSSPKVELWKYYSPVGPPVMNWIFNKKTKTPTSSSILLVERELQFRAGKVGVVYFLWVWPIVETIEYIN